MNEFPVLATSCILSASTDLIKLKVAMLEARVADRSRLLAPLDFGYSLCVK